MTHLFARTEVYETVEKDETFRKWWIDSGLTKSDFIHRYRKAIETRMNIMQAESYLCPTCGDDGYGAWNCTKCGSHDIERKE